MGFAKTKRAGAALTAVERARRAWSDMARETRTEIHQLGLLADVRYFDDRAKGARGAAVPTGLHKTAYEMKAAGIPRTDAEERLTGIARYIVALAYHDGGAA